jgi:hypothetical protein
MSGPIIYANGPPQGMVYPGQYPQVPPQMPPGPQVASNPAVRQPQIRGKGPEQPPQVPMVMPRPEQVGVSPARPEQAALVMPRPDQVGVAPARPEQLVAAGGVDWKATRARLDELKATSFALSHEVDGYHFVILLSTGKPNEAYHVDVKAATEVEAVEAGLKRASETCR